ncbi:MAG: hypothetical protein QOF77_672 [Solirubrobacteraceae bacterium]|nr:hypothetical protein [Solirubrobacteraceae bacterium]
MTSLAWLDRRLLFVTGKGGVGKSTVAAALGLRAARLGRRTVVAEIGGRGDLPRMFATGPAAAYGERELAPGLFTIDIDPRLALEEYLADQLPLRALADLLGSSRTFAYLTAATPGLPELLCMGKVWELAQRRRRTAAAQPYDLVILDAPATGHAIALLAAPQTFTRAAQVGPIARQAGRIAATLADPRLTSVVAVCTPQEPAVTETLETRRRVADELGLDPGRVVVNTVRPRRFAPRDRAALGRALAVERTPAERQALELAVAEEHRIRLQGIQIARLRRSLDERPVELPFLPTGAIGVDELERLGQHLEAW